MKLTLNAILMIVMVLGLSACQPSEPEDDGEHLLQDYENAMDRARDVEDDLKEAAERQRRAIEERGG